MARPGFFNDNEGRNFPFQQGEILAGGFALPDPAVVDFGAVMGIRSGFDAASHSVWLQTVSVGPSDITFVFDTDAPQAAGDVLTFVHAKTSTYVTSYEEGSDPGCQASQCANEPPGWTAYLVTGDLTVFDDFPTGDYAVTGGLIEHGLIRSLGGSYVRSLNLANDDRTRASNPSGCFQPCLPMAFGPYNLNRRCIAGRVELLAGYNAVISQDSVNQSLTLGAAPGAGEGVVCNDEVRRFSGERPPINRPTLDGALLCSEVIRSINGVGGPILNFLTGAGVSVTPDPDNHKVIVDVNMRGLAVCLPSDDETWDYDEPETSASTTCSCGPAGF